MTARIHSHAAGFTLTEVLIGVGLTSLIAIGVAQLAVDQSRSVSAVSGKVQQIGLAADIRNSIGAMADCQASLASATGALDPAKLALLAPQAVKIRVKQVSATPLTLDTTAGPQTVAGYGTILTALYLTNFQQLKPDAGNDRYLADLVMTSEPRKAPQESKPAYAPVALGRVYLTTAPSTAAIVSCFSHLSEAPPAAPLRCGLLGAAQVPGAPSDPNCNNVPVVTAVTCPDGYYLQGFVVSGQATCLPTPPPTYVASPYPISMTGYTPGPTPTVTVTQTGTPFPSATPSSSPSSLMMAMSQHCRSTQAPNGSCSVDFNIKSLAQAQDPSTVGRTIVSIFLQFRAGANSTDGDCQNSIYQLSGLADASNSFTVNSTFSSKGKSISSTIACSPDSGGCTASSVARGWNDSGFTGCVYIYGATINYQ